MVGIVGYYSYKGGNSPIDYVQSNFRFGLKTLGRNHKNNEIPEAH